MVTCITFLIYFENLKYVVKKHCDSEWRYCLASFYFETKVNFQNFLKLT